MPKQTTSSFDLLQRQLEASLEQSTARALQKLNADSQSYADKAITKALNIAMQQLATQLTQQITSNVATGATASTNDSGLQSLGTALNRLVTLGVNTLFEREKQVRVTGGETDRSKQAQSSYRLSRGQQQSDALKATEKGQRNA